MFNAADRNSLDQILAREPIRSQEVLDFFKSKYADIYAHDAGVWEGYTIEEHTLMVMNQYDRYFLDATLSLGVSPGLFKVILALHDIGKPKAIKAGDKRLQHEYTQAMVEQILRELGYSQHDIAITTALVSGDPIGMAVKGYPPEISAQFIAELAKEKELPAKVLFELFLILYQVDAGSYTEDAGGLHSLDALFVFQPEAKMMHLADGPQRSVDELKKLL